MSEPAVRESALPTPAELTEALRARSSQVQPGTFAGLVGAPGAHVQESAEVLDKTTKRTLCDVPFVILRIQFSKGDKGFFMPNIRNDKVTLEVITATDHKVIVNDGSTGIRRQAVTFCIERGWVNPGAPVFNEEKNQGSPNALDKPVELWAEGQDQAYAGFDLVAAGCQWVATRGLRVSEYTHPEFGEAETYYIQ